MPNARSKCNLSPRVDCDRPSNIGQLHSSSKNGYEFRQRNHRSLSPRLLLRHAVQGAEAEDQIARGDADNFAIRE